MRIGWVEEYWLQAGDGGLIEKKHVKKIMVNGRKFSEKRYAWINFEEKFVKEKDWSWLKSGLGSICQGEGLIMA